MDDQFVAVWANPLGGLVTAFVAAAATAMSAAAASTTTASATDTNTATISFDHSR
jgi:hypothetical protein